MADDTHTNGLEKLPKALNSPLAVAVRYRDGADTDVVEKPDGTREHTEFPADYFTILH